MGYGVMAYRADLDRVMRFYGLGDEHNKRQFRADFGDRFRKLDDNFEPEHGWAAATTLLDGFIDGKVPATDGNTSKHWYVLECFVKASSLPLDNSAWYPSDIAPLFKLPEFKPFSFARGRAEGMVLKGSDGFPMVFTVLHKDLKKAAASVQASALDAEQKAQFQAWVTEIKTVLKAKKHDLILYYY